MGNGVRNNDNVPLINAKSSNTSFFKHSNNAKRDTLQSYSFINWVNSRAEESIRKIRSDNCHMVCRINIYFCKGKPFPHSKIPHRKHVGAHSLVTDRFIVVFIHDFGLAIDERRRGTYGRLALQSINISLLQTGNDYASSGRGRRKFTVIRCTGQNDYEV